MKNKIPISILGATGMVGQNYVRLLANHPWFIIVDLAASPRSAGKPYAQAVENKWLMPEEIPPAVSDILVRDVQNFDAIPAGVACVFSAMDLPDKADTRELEFEYARKGYPMVSNSSANRWTEDVPMIIPEINAHHTDVIPLQQTNRQLPKTGFVAVKPNCSIQSYIITIAALQDAGYPIEKIQVTTLQALSGAGHKGLTSPEMQENVIPLISGEEAKTENEPKKILGTVGKKGIENFEGLQISAMCTRVPIRDGHTAVVHLSFKDKIPSLDEIKKIWQDYRGLPQQANLPFAPEVPIVYLEEDDRPQAKVDRDRDKGMAVTVGRLDKDKFFDIRYVGLSHNTIRGAAGGAILMAELLVEKGYIGGKRDN